MENPSDGAGIRKGLRLLTRDEICAALGLTPEGLRTRIKRGVFPPPVHGYGRRAVWREDALVNN